MKIAHIVCVFPPYGGGIGTTCYQQVLSLVDQGHQVTVFTPKYDKTQQLLSEIVDFEVQKIKPFLKFGNAAVLSALLKKLKNFDLVQLHYPFIGSSLLVWFWKKFLSPKTRLVVFYHMDLVGTGFKGFIFKLYSKIATPLVLLAADRIFVSSLDYILNSNIAKFYQKHSAKFFIKPFLIDTERFYPQEKDAELLKKLNLTRDHRVVLFVGGLDRAHYFKGLPVLFAAWQKIKLDQTKLVIVGSGDLANFYLELAKRLRIEDDVIFAGYALADDLSKYYNLADIFVLPSIDKSEAFGVVTLEAQACAKPVIVSDLPGVRQTLENGQTGLVFKLNQADDLADKLAQLLNDQSFRLAMGEKARSRVEEYFSQQKIDYIYE
jgi:glycosyltransferase involved in cell wall biosynthesis